MPPNVLLIVMDSVRARNMSIYDHENETTPAIDRFAGRATTYTQARAPSTWSLPSHASMFTGYHAEEHRLYSRYDRLEPGNTIWERLREERGYATAAFSHNPFVTKDLYGLAAGFETVESSLPTTSYPFDRGLNPDTFRPPPDADRSDAIEYLRASLGSEHPIQSIANGVLERGADVAPGLLPGGLRPTPASSAGAYCGAFLDWQEGRGGPWAACINVIDAHDPYRPLEEFDEWGGADLQRLYEGLDDHRWEFFSGRRPWWQRRALEALYDGCIRQVDAAVGSVLEALEDRGELEDTLVVLTSDHGEGFGERSKVRDGFRVVGHSGGVDEVILHVPLVVKYPGQTTGDTVSAPASLTAFPSVVEDAIEGTVEHGAFSPDGPVLASVDQDGQYAYPPSSIDPFEEELDMELFSGTALVAYERTDRRVRKSVVWGGDSATVEIVDAQESMRVDDGGRERERVSRRFDGIAGVDVATDNRRSDGIDDDTLEHLKELGYA